MNLSSNLSRRSAPGFTLVELLVSTSLLGLLILVMLSLTQQTSATWRMGRSKVEQFRQARLAFETMTRRLSQATLNPHWDYQYAADDPKKERPPIAYVRQSRLRFRSGEMRRLAPGQGKFRPTHGVFFQAPLGAVESNEYENLDRLLNTVGYFLEVGDDRDTFPSFLEDTGPVRVRSRLLELRKPAEDLSIYQLEPGKPNDTWFAKALDEPDRPVRVLAENIVALVLLPSLAQADEAARAAEQKKVLSPRYDYDSTLTSNHVPPLSPPDPEINPRHQLPPVLRVYMYAVDEESAQRMQELANGDPGLGLQTETLFHEASKLDQDGATSDLGLFEKQLAERRLKFRLFNTNVSLRGAKWSRSQTL